MNDSGCIKQSFFDRLCRLDGSGEWKANNVCLATGVVLIWALTGPVFSYSDTWQLAINTGTTIVTF
jgi:low affinity Fe/Cu permease